MTSKRKWHARRIAFGVALSVAVTAMAFFVSTYLSEGTVEHKTGAAANLAQKVNISFPDAQLTPTNPVPITATVENTSGGPRVWKSFVMSIETPTVPTCAASWLEIYPEKETGVESSPWKQILAGTNATAMAPIATGTQNIFNPANGELKAVYLRFKPGLTESTNEKSCEGVSIKLNGKLTE